jgi:hypothetical protein
VTGGSVRSLRNCEIANGILHQNCATLAISVSIENARTSCSSLYSIFLMFSSEVSASVSPARSPAEPFVGLIDHPIGLLTREKGHRGRPPNLNECNRPISSFV